MPDPVNAKFKQARNIFLIDYKFFKLIING